MCIKNVYHINNFSSIGVLEEIMTRFSFKGIHFTLYFTLKNIKKLKISDIKINLKIN